MSKLATTFKIAGAMIGLGAVVLGTLVYRQVHPPLPRGMATLAATHLTAEDGSPILLGKATAPAAATIISFWATWCVPCRAEATALAVLRQRHSPHDLAIVYLNVDDVPNSIATAKFLQATHSSVLRVLPVTRAGPRLLEAAPWSCRGHTCSIVAAGRRQC